MRFGSQLRGQSFAVLLIACFLIVPIVSARGQKITLKHAVELALVHSPAAAEVSAGDQKAFHSYRETRNNYIPQLVVGAGLGESWGYPLSLEGSAPSLFNVTAQSALINPALRDAIRASELEYRATQAAGKDRRNQIVLDTVLAYLELVKWERLVGHERQQQQNMAKTQQAAEQRVEAGIDSPQMLTQAKLGVARANLRALQSQGSLQSLRASLSQLTGVPAESVEVDPDSVPPFPALPSDPEAEAMEAANSSPAVLFAQQHALAQGFRARAEHRSLWPSVDFAAQYAVLAKYNNWLQFFPAHAFERNNATVGVVIRFPFFNASQHAHAEAADADAAHATAEMRSTKNQVSQQLLKLQNSVRQLAAAKEVSELEYELAKSNFDEVQIRMTSGGATIHDDANARADMSEKYDQLQDAEFDLVRGHLAWLRATGELNTWVGIPK